MSDIQKWADKAMFEAEPQPTAGENGVKPQVTLLWMTPDPLGAVAAMSAMYEGRVIRDLHEDLIDEDREKALVDVMQTHLQAPLEAIKLHFLIEGVDRAFTHQLVRQRTAVYAQESMRFAVVGDLADATTLPPSLEGTREDDPRRLAWDRAVQKINESYHSLVNQGIPAEDARGLLPHCTATRIHFITDMRNLLAHSGNRLCTQAQFVWRDVFSQIVSEISTYIPSDIRALGRSATSLWIDEFGWQFSEIASSGLFKPVCYQLGHCPFKASFDRACSIRERVDANALHGVPSSEWAMNTGLVKPINPAEWLLDPTAAREV